MNEHSHPHGDHEHAHHPPAPQTPIDPGSQALSEALRSSFAVVKVVMAVLVVALLASGFFQVGPQEQAIILRFGKPVGEGKDALLGPGLHWSLPYPIDEYVKIPITGLQQVRSTIGWYATTPAQEAAGPAAEPPPGPSLNPAVDGYVITADGNIVHARATLYYRIEDPIRYEFSFTNAAQLVQLALDNALIQTAARFKVDDILTANLAGFRDAVQQRAVALIEERKLGVSVDRCEVQSIPPRILKPSFDGVVTAGQKRRTALDDAQKYSNEVLNRAAADSQSLTNIAETERVAYVRQLNSLANNFQQILPDYSKNPQLFVQQRLNEVLGRSLTNAEKWVLPSSVNGNSTELRLLLNREPPKPRTPPPQ